MGITPLLAMVCTFNQKHNKNLVLRYILPDFMNECTRRECPCPEYQNFESYIQQCLNVMNI